MSDMAASAVSEANLKLPPLSATTYKSKNRLRDKPVEYVPKDVNDLTIDYRNKSEITTILNAIRVGYLIYPSKELIWSIFSKQADFNLKQSQRQTKVTSKYTRRSDTVFENDPTKIGFLNLSRLPMIEMGDLDLCTNLTVLNLSNNYLIEIDPISRCHSLFRLDLHNNQLVELPDQYFWHNMRKLRVLFLHSNPISSLESLKFLGAAPSLELLTLYDSPISIRENYRHHAVNSIFTLKALDRFVVSDEEIIEEANFRNRFSAKHRNFRIHLAFGGGVSDQASTLRSELRATFELIRKVNRIMAFNSPVLIIQKNVRRYLARKMYRKMRLERRM